MMRHDGQIVSLDLVQAWREEATASPVIKGFGVPSDALQGELHRQGGIRLPVRAETAVVQATGSNSLLFIGT
jgi:hypothetical protein